MYIYIFFYPNICNILFADEETSPPPVPPKLAGRRKSGEIFKLVMQIIFVSTEKLLQIFIYLLSSFLIKL